ncbi:MAG: hypothetical protein M3459_10005 [Actinomycetota bacterium]|nr:hypothetical protein [Actinomycetota bacterium]
MTETSSYDDRLVREFTEYIRRAGRTHTRMMSEWPCISLEEVYVDRSTRPPRLVATFRHDDRPGCLFGFAAEAWSETGDDFSPEVWAGILAVNLGEAIEADDMGLPPECVDEGVTWLDLGD